MTTVLTIWLYDIGVFHGNVTTVAVTSPCRTKKNNVAMSCDRVLSQCIRVACPWRQFGRQYNAQCRMTCSCYHIGVGPVWPMKRTDDAWPFNICPTAVTLFRRSSGVVMSVVCRQLTDVVFINDRVVLTFAMSSLLPYVVCIAMCNIFAGNRPA